ncbi:TPA_asm: hypothetical protein GND37_003218 [Salmonella enterica subsp. enterica serovar Typhisuis]|uniref:Uncharacterized protein n=1 Tax=Salmonella typhisuis TaxID=41529 RepID=A0A735MYD7_SALTP|nr:hypothetical protein [Salmonella enterica subsp. enterica serovar Typhisuis]
MMNRTQWPVSLCLRGVIVVQINRIRSASRQGRDQTYGPEAFWHARIQPP